MREPTEQGDKRDQSTERTVNVNAPLASVGHVVGELGVSPPEQEPNEDAHTGAQDGHGEAQASHAARGVPGLQVAQGLVAPVGV